MDGQLPPELLHIIIGLKLAAYNTFDGWRDPTERYSILKLFALVNFSWRESSESFLYQWVVLGSEETALKFLASAEKRGEEIGVRDLFLDSAEIQSGTLARILKSTPDVDALVLRDEMVDMNDLAPLQHLRRLELINITIKGSTAPPTFSLPSLEHIAMYSSLFDEPAASHFLTPAFLPQLRYLDKHDTGIPLTARPLMRQLAAAKLQPEHAHLLSSTTKSLLLLHVPFVRGSRGEMVFHLTFFPPFLSLAPNDRAGVILSTLEQLLATPTTRLRVILTETGLWGEALTAVKRRLQDRGIRLEEKWWVPFAGGNQQD